MIVNVVCDILCKTTDLQIIQRGTSFLRFYIPLCAEIIEKKYFALLRNQRGQIFKVISTLFNSQVLESGLLYMGNVVSQYFLHLQKKIEVTILESIVKRLYKVNSSKLVQNAQRCAVDDPRLLSAVHPLPRRHLRIPD